MSIAQPSTNPGPGAVPERRASPLSLNLSSNNPFRKASSVGVPSPALPSPDSLPRSARPISRNPFLAEFEQATEGLSKPANTPLIRAMSPPNRSSPVKPAFGNDVEDLFGNLTVSEKPRVRRPSPQPSGRATGYPPNQRRPSGPSDMEKSSSQGPPRSRRAPPPPLGSPEKSENRRPRRNSESSVIGPIKSLDDDRRRRGKQRESSRSKDKDGKSKESRSSGRTRKPGGFDMIDNLDVTGIYGSGLFHHDGPFDACNPHRNRRRDHRSPMNAFPANSANNVLGPSGPVNKTFDIARFQGTGAEGFTDYNSGARADKSAQRGSLWNPIERVEQVHGEETAGLGTSTFLDGAPASRNAIQRRESEAEREARLAGLDPNAGGGLGRKKSLAQRIRGMSAPRRPLVDANGMRITSPGARSGAMPSPGSSSERAATSAGSKNENQPFFSDYDEAYDKKGAAIRQAKDGAGSSFDEVRRGSVPAVPEVPPLPTQDEISVVKPLERAAASEVKKPAVPTVTIEREQENAMDPTPKSGGGFMTRMKSLKGGRRKP